MWASGKLLKLSYWLGLFVLFFSSIKHFFTVSPRGGREEVLNRRPHPVSGDAAGDR